MKSPVQTLCITTRRPRDESDPGEAAIIHYTADEHEVRITDKDGHLLRYEHSGEPCKQALGPGDNPRQIAARLGLRYHNRIYGDRESGFNAPITYKKWTCV
jgi:hypothetical protein